MFILVFTMLMNAKVPTPIDTAQLITQISQEENVDPILLAKVVITESRGNAQAINQKSKDYGIAQINLKSHPQVSYKCAMDKVCGLRAGAKILAKASRPCQYNVGKAKLTEIRLKKCLQYERKLASIR
jgi:hypothetical protein